ncbi:fibronectin type III domain-containing protein [Dactylosporangium sp. NPDC000521]|uniref:fibronectin type III domain-containing protein n=1 Tax=Dactylosporangium sp. NPDC000521 TaxID=3363975 RepID=UPI0036BC5250
MLALTGLSAPASADPGAGRSPSSRAGAEARDGKPATGESSGKPAAGRSGSAEAGDKARVKTADKTGGKADAKTGSGKSARAGSNASGRAGDKTGSNASGKAGDKAGSGKSGAAGKGRPSASAGAAGPAGTARSGSAAASASADDRTVHGFARTLSTHARPAAPGLKVPPAPPWHGKNSLASPGTATVEASPSPGGAGDPMAPTITSVVETATTFTVTWTSVPGSTGYVVSVNGNGVLSCTVSPCTFSDMIFPGVNQVVVYSYISGTPRASAPWLAELQPSEPGAPQVTPSRTGTAITIDYEPAAGETGIDAYETEVTVSGSNPVVTVPCTVATATSCTIAGQAGTTYQVKVRAHNSVGWSPFETTTVTVPPLPAAPTAQATVSGTTVTVTWTEAPGATGITGHTVLVNRTDGGSPVPVACTTVPSVEANTPPGWVSGSSCTVAGVVGATYSVEVRSYNSTGPSTAGTTTAVIAGPPAAPGVTTSVAGSTITVNWTPGSDGGAAITSYVVTLVPQSAPTAPTLPCTPPLGAPTPAVSCTATGMPGQTYDVEVAAVNVAGTSNPGTATAAVAAVAPAAPTVTAAASGTTITVNWSPNGTGGAPISAYQVTVARQGTPATALTCTPASPTGTTCSTTGVPGATYDVAVTAQNSAGVSAGGTATVTLEAAAPAAPAVSASVAGDLIKADWTPGETGGAPILSYTVTVTRASGAGPASPACATASPLATTCGFAGIPGAAYTVSVAAVNAKGASPAGTASVTMPAVTAPAVTVVPGDTTIDVTWTVPVPAAAVTGYTVTAAPATGSPITATIAGGATTSHRLTGATNQVTYQVTVAATVAEGDATTSAPLAVTPAAPVTVPATVPPTAVDGVLTSSAGTALPSAGQPTVLVGTGFAPRTWVQLLVYSSPTALGTALTDEHGEFSKQVTVPAGMSGGHTFVSMGTDPSGTLRVLKLAVTVGAAPADVQAPGSGGGGLPVTGPPVTLLTLAALALIAGGAATRVAGSQVLAERLRFRRRR